MHIFMNKSWIEKKIGGHRNSREEFMSGWKWCKYKLNTQDSQNKHISSFCKATLFYMAHRKLLAMLFLSEKLWLCLISIPTAYKPWLLICIFSSLSFRRLDIIPLYSMFPFSLWQAPKISFASSVLRPSYILNEYGNTHRKWRYVNAYW